MKTKEECKDEVARKHGSENWKEYRSRMGTSGMYSTIEDRLDEAMDIYAQEKWKEACEEQKEVAVEYFNTQQIDKDNIMDAPLPPFKA